MNLLHVYMCVGIRDVALFNYFGDDVFVDSTFDVNHRGWCSLGCDGRNL